VAEGCQLALAGLEAIGERLRQVVEAAGDGEVALRALLLGRQVGVFEEPAAERIAEQQVATLERAY
jgi:hypothetical protein